MTAVIGIQATTSSARLPGKVMMDLGGRPMILQTWGRLGEIPTRRYVLTSTDQSDESLVQLLKSKQIPVRRGSLTDVRSRFIELACETKAEIIVLASGEAPFVDPLFINLAIRICEMHGGMCLVRARGSLLEGMDVFTTKALFNTLDRDDPETLESAGLTAMLADDEVQKVLVGMGPDYQNPKIAKLSIDTPEDMKFAQRFWEHLQGRKGDLRKAISSWTGA